MLCSVCFFFNHTATPDIYTLSLHDALPISFFAAPVIWLTGNLLLAANFVCLLSSVLCGLGAYVLARRIGLSVAAAEKDRKSTRLNSSHSSISYAVFCLKKKKRK